MALIECYSKALTLQLPVMMNILLLPKISTHYPLNRQWEYSDLSGRSCYLDLASNSYNWSTRKCEAAREEN